ncbi:MAG: hypothetical protein P4L90_23685 [Rhodopila sp.]|nr:hypothetical protein [Rhodopila sp.]
MTHEMFSRFFSMKTLTRVAFAALSLGFGVANAEMTKHGAPQQGGDQYNVLRGGGG